MTNETKILITGGSGLLGREFKKLLPKALYPLSSEFNVEDFKQMQKYLRGKKITTIVHAAAATATKKIEENPGEALRVNIIGSSNIALLCLKLKTKLVYISTDYIFAGKKGNYKETDPVLPVNKYAWSKLGGECAVRLTDDFIIIRTSFGPARFPYDSAFVNQYTSKERVDKIARKIVRLIKSRPAFKGVIHIGGKRTSVYNYAKNLDKSRLIKRDKLAHGKKAGMARPVDASLNTKLYSSLMR